jgi:hypothetical protein
MKTRKGNLNHFTFGNKWADRDFVNNKPSEVNKRERKLKVMGRNIETRINHLKKYRT